MSWNVLLLAAAAAAAAAVLLVMVVKLRGGGRDDLMGPPKPQLSPEELDRMTEMVRRGEQEEVKRQLKSAGCSDAGVRTLLWLMTKLAED